MNEKIYNEWYKSCKGNLKSIESTINHRHIADLFTQQEITKEQLVYIGIALKDMWETKLNRLFPDRKIVVDLRNGEDELLNHIITVYQDRS